MNTTNVVFVKEDVQGPETLLSKAVMANIVADLAVRVGPGWNVQQKVTQVLKCLS